MSSPDRANFEHGLSRLCGQWLTSTSPTGCCEDKYLPVLRSHCNQSQEATEIRPRRTPPDDGRNGPGETLFEPQRSRCSAPAEAPIALSNDRHGARPHRAWDLTPASCALRETAQRRRRLPSLAKAAGSRSGGRRAKVPRSWRYEWPGWASGVRGRRWL